VDKNKKIIYSVTGIYVSLFVVLIGYMIYFTAIKQKQIAIHPYNTRLNNVEQEVVRGTIYDANMEILATTTEGIRKYPKASLYAHAIGYSQRGKIGIEALANTELLYPNYTIVSLFRNAFADEKFEGRDIVVTLDDRYQSAIAQAMAGKKGGIVVMEPATGKIKAMYAAPGFDPNNITQDWEALTQDTVNSPLVNRTTSGIYPPGSTFKIITALAYIDQMKDEAMQFTYDCTGKITGDGYAIQCYNKTAHGKVNLESAFYKSCNAYFIKMNENLTVKNLKATAEKLGFNHAIHFDMDYAKSRFQLQETDSAFEKAATYIGQGKTLTTPLHMAMLASCIANDGVSMKPYLIDYSMNKKGKLKVKYLPQYEGILIEEEIAQKMQQLMIQVVDQGTATQLKSSQMIVGGKTGTAQNETPQDHSWFVGFVKRGAESKSDLAFAVIVENGGKGAKALEVTQSILDVYNQINP
jgi:peptidoglycan glycosyltransferase